MLGASSISKLLHRPNQGLVQRDLSSGEPVTEFPQPFQWAQYRTVPEFLVQFQKVLSSKLNLFGLCGYYLNKGLVLSHYNRSKVRKKQ